LHSGRVQAFRALDPQPGQHVLEVGAGTGLSLQYYPQGVRITGIDLTASMLDKARRRASEQGRDEAEFHVMDAQAMTFEDDYFDQVVAMYIVSVVPDASQLISEMRRVCKPGGRLTVVNLFTDTHGFSGALRRVLKPFTRWLGFRPLYTYDDFIAASPGLQWVALDDKVRGLSVLQAVNPG
jgi:phosphatidylethanolamine/phosphatidyl-N-methylethanolamine N-methyltransferase